MLTECDKFRVTGIGIERLGTKLDIPENANNLMLIFIFPKFGKLEIILGVSWCCGRVQSPNNITKSGTENTEQNPHQHTTQYIVSETSRSPFCF